MTTSCIFLTFVFVSTLNLVTGQAENCVEIVCGDGILVGQSWGLICSTNGEFVEKRSLTLGNHTIVYCRRRCIQGKCPSMMSCHHTPERRCLCPMPLPQHSAKLTCAEIDQCNRQYICGDNQACMDILESFRCTTTVTSNTPSAAGNNSSRSAAISRTTLSTRSTATEDETDVPILCSLETWVGVGGGVLGAIIMGLLITVICLLRRKVKQNQDDIRSRRDNDNAHSNGLDGSSLAPRLDGIDTATVSVEQPEISLSSFGVEAGQRPIDTYDYAQVNRNVRINGHDYVEAPSLTNEPVFSTEGVSHYQNDTLARLAPPIVSIVGSFTGYEQVDIIGSDYNNPVNYQNLPERYPIGGSAEIRTVQLDTLISASAETSEDAKYDRLNLEENTTITSPYARLSPF